MRYLSVFALLVLVVAFSQPVLANKVLYIQSTKANILDKPSFTGTSVAEALKGKVVEVISQKPNWVQIKIDDQQGWVASMLLGPTPPLSNKSLFDKLKHSSTVKKTNNVRTRASIQTTAAATRGLSNRTVVSDDIEKNYRGVQSVESHKVTTKDAWKFHKNLSQPN